MTWARFSELLIAVRKEYPAIVQLDLHDERRFVHHGVGVHAHHLGLGSRFLDGMAPRGFVAALLRAQFHAASDGLRPICAVRISTISLRFLVGGILSPFPAAMSRSRSTGAWAISSSSERLNPSAVTTRSTTFSTICGADLGASPRICRFWMASSAFFERSSASSVSTAFAASMTCPILTAPMLMWLEIAATRSSSLAPDSCTICGFRRRHTLESWNLVSRSHGTFEICARGSLVPQRTSPAPGICCVLVIMIAPKKRGGPFPSRPEFGRQAEETTGAASRQP